MINDYNYYYVLLKLIYVDVSPRMNIQLLRSSLVKVDIKLP